MYLAAILLATIIVVTVRVTMTVMVSSVPRMEMVGSPSVIVDRGLVVVGRHVPRHDGSFRVVTTAFRHLYLEHVTDSAPQGPPSTVNNLSQNFPTCVMMTMMIRRHLMLILL